MIQNGIFINPLPDQTIQTITPESTLFWFHIFLNDLLKKTVCNESDRILKEFGTVLLDFLYKMKEKGGAELASSVIFYSKLTIYKLYSLRINDLKEEEKKQYAEEHRIVIIKNEYYVSLSSLFNNNLKYKYKESLIPDNILISLSDHFVLSDSSDNHQTSLENLKVGEIICCGDKNNEGDVSGALLSVLLLSKDPKGEHEKANIFVGIDNKARMYPTTLEEVKNKWNSFETSTKFISQNTKVPINIHLLICISNYDTFPLPSQNLNKILITTYTLPTT
eukprot:TRINITY_DN1209_c3_g1_i2.p1 TRINITY_DN1209_c3_g1~~TRINITY_DN1209_c3_g1_i2.p1  ORF type:complete len:278 (+),score=98.21 TRINITY_DN1209_c3_g1_i2:1578-2411(+)